MGIALAAGAPAAAIDRMIAAVVAVRLVMAGSLVPDRTDGGDPVAVVLAAIISERHVPRHGRPGVHAMPAREGFRRRLTAGEGSPYLPEVTHRPAGYGNRVAGGG